MSIKNIIFCAVLVSVLATIVVGESVGSNLKINRSQIPQAFVKLSEPEVLYSIGIWDVKLGNHRAVLSVEETSVASKVHIPWRRRDTDAANKNITVVDAQTGNVVQNRIIQRINSESVDLIFEPTSGAGDYYIYYLTPRSYSYYVKNRVTSNQRNFPSTTYVTPEETADHRWISKIKGKDLPVSMVKTIQALKVTGPKKFASFNSFYPMEVIATAAETNILEQQLSAFDFVVFPESREFPIRMTDDLPLSWIKKGPQSYFKGQVDKNEFFTFQLGLYALKDLQNIKVNFSELKGPSLIPATSFRCFNMGGTNYDGKPFSKEVHLKKSHVQALWMGLDVPADAKPGYYRGTVTIKADQAKSVKVELNITVLDKFLADKGDSDPSRLSRLRWLDSTIGLDETAQAPFIPIRVTGKTFDILGRTIKLSETGLPSSVVSRISMMDITKTGREVLNSPVAFVVETKAGREAFVGKDFKVTKQSQGKVEFDAKMKSDNFNAVVYGTLECDGYMHYNVKLLSLKDVEIKDIRLELPYRKKLAKYLMGRIFPEGKGGETYAGARPRVADGKISDGLMFNTVWSGDYNAGLALCLRNDKEQWNGDNKTKSKTPTLSQWENKGQGKYTLKEVGNTALIAIHNGSRQMKAGEELSLSFVLLATPFKPITKAHWDYRIYHAPYSTEPRLGNAANSKVVNIHHANSLNPYINYPFLNEPILKGFIDTVHESGRKAKLYYTVRELTTRSAEFWALRSLGDEVFIQDDGYLGLQKHPLSLQRTRFHRSGYLWLAEHLIDNYRMRWHSYLRKTTTPQNERKQLGPEVDASIAVQGLSRWHNYYLEGLRYSMEKIGSDGLYLDGIGYDREIMKRVYKTMQLAGKEPMMDFHGSIHQNWMTLAPYITSNWNGEEANYSLGPDYWLTEISGIPFGLTGEILKNGRDANIHRGMLYGMARRLGWVGNYKAQHVWKLWDDFGIKDSKQISYFEPNCPVTTDHDKIKATVYVKKGKTLLCLASWEKKPTKVKLSIDWKALGLDPSKVTMMAPALKTIQEKASFKVGQPITVPGTTGWMIILEEK